MQATIIKSATDICAGDSSTFTVTANSNLSNLFSYQWSNGDTSTTIPVSDANIYTVIINDTNGCSTLASASVSVNPTYNIPLTHSICQGESYNFYGQNLTTAGTYTHTLQTVNGCDSVLTLTFTVRPVPTPTISGNTTLCQGQSTTLTANGGVSYLWSDASTNNSISVSQSGIYTVTATNAEGCSATANTLTVGMAGTYQVIGYNAAGCNAMASATVNVWQPATSEFSIECPDSCYIWNGESYCQSGDYIKNLQTIHGCDSVVTLHLTITVGIDNHDLAASMSVYPNPTNGIVNVQFTNHNSPITHIHVFDAYGKLVGVETFHEIPVETFHETSLQYSGFIVNLFMFSQNLLFLRFRNGRFTYD